MNVWLLFQDHRVDHVDEVVRGPFTNVALDDHELVDMNSGNSIARSNEDNNWTVDGRRYDTVIFQSGGFTTPWGERGS